VKSRRLAQFLGMGSLLAIVVLAFAAAPAMAAGATTTAGSSDVGSNIGTWLTNLGQDLLIPIAGLLGLAAFFRRDVGHAITIVVIAMIVGIFVYDRGGATAMITTVANTFTGGK
jgi:hypothetical protein